MGSIPVSRRHRSWLWLLILPVAFTVYSSSFKDFPILERHHSILAEADSACFTLMMRDFHLTKQYGQPYNKVNRSIGDVAQKHKTHHVFYLLVASPLYRFFSGIYRALGISFFTPEYSVNAAIACVNIVLLFLILSRIEGGGALPGIVICLYTVSLNTWILGSVPESWTFSATLVLLFLFLLPKMREHYLLLSVSIGIAMLNNVFLGTLALFLVFLHREKAGDIKTVVFRSVVTGVVAIGTWAVLMTFLSLFDAGLSPLHYVRYTLWFKKNIAPPINVTDSYFWKVSFSNLFVNSVVSNQSEPNIPQEAIRYTFQQSPLGIVSTGMYAALACLAIYRTAHRYIDAIRGSGFRSAVLSEFPEISIVAFCMLWVAMAVILDASGAFLFSSIIVPLLMILLGHAFRIGRTADKYLLYATVAAVLINNADQVMKFRHALALMG
jgi:hypothetical protein